MPDIKSALSKALEEWSNEEKTQEKQMDSRSNMPQTFKTTNNITRLTFNYVKNNPGLTAKQVGQYVDSLGLKAHSAIAMMSASVKNGIMRKDEFSRYYTTVDEYVPLKKINTKKKPIAKPVSKGIKALLPTPEVQEALAELAKPKVKQELTNEYILANLSVKQALSLYRELIDIFTGKA